jgi:hypothetical protein
MSQDEIDELKIHTGIEGYEQLEKILDEATENVAGEEEAEELPRLARPPQRSQYFGQPVNWQKSAGFLSNLDLMQAEYDQQVFHKAAINQVKKALGSKCTYLSHIKDEKGSVTVKAKLNINGKITTFNVNLGLTHPDDFTADTYKALNETLQKHLKSDVKTG